MSPEGAVRRRQVGDGRRVDPFAREREGLGLDDGVVLTSPGDEVFDGQQRETLTLGQRRELRHPHHGAVVVDELGDPADLAETRETHEVDRRLGVPSTVQDTTRHSAQREHVARTDEVPRA
jgi:hypothetical protein